jgi:secreted trypsin-like serine protease
MMRSFEMKRMFKQISYAIVLALSLCCAFTFDTRSQSAPLARTLEEARDGRIVKVFFGNDARIQEHPWQAALLSSQIDDNYKAQFCGGSIIDSNWILTAAHCVDNNTTIKDIEVISGVDELKRSTIQQRLKITAIYLHSTYTTVSDKGSSYPNNDIALLKVASALNGRAIPLGEQVHGKMGTISGFGRTQMGARASRLQAGEMEILSLEECNSVKVWDGRITSSMICAGDPFGTGQAAGCNGDSGGPFTSEGRLAGVVSWGAPECGSNSTVFAKIDFFLRDIADCIKDESKCNKRWDLRQ